MTIAALLPFVPILLIFGLVFVKLPAKIDGYILIGLALVLFVWGLLDHTGPNLLLAALGLCLGFYKLGLFERRQHP